MHMYCFYSSTDIRQGIPGVLRSVPESVNYSVRVTFTNTHHNHNLVFTSHQGEAMEGEGIVMVEGVEGQHVSMY